MTEPLQVRAAQRLVAAYADEAAARSFLKSVTGVSVGKVEYSAPGVIRFQLADQQAFDIALENLTKRYGKPDRSTTVYNSKAGRWYLDDAKTKIIWLSDAKFGGGLQKDPFSISLVDTEHQETTTQMMQRLAGPSRAITR